jgi:hypothetical protein
VSEREREMIELITYIHRVYDEPISWFGERRECPRSHEHAHDRVHAVAVALPHGAELGLARNVPYLQRDVPAPDLAEVEGDGRDDVLAPLRSGSGQLQSTEVQAPDLA